MNQIAIVGRLVEEPRQDTLKVAVNRSFKNAEGEYETDFLEVKICGELARNTVEYCRRGDIIGIRGRIQSKKIDDGDGHYMQIPELVAERVTFLSQSREGGSV